MTNRYALVSKEKVKNIIIADEAFIEKIIKTELHWDFISLVENTPGSPGVCWSCIEKTFSPPRE